MVDTSVVPSADLVRALLVSIPQDTLLTEIIESYTYNNNNQDQSRRSSYYGGNSMYYTFSIMERYTDQVVQTTTMARSTVAVTTHRVARTVTLMSASLERLPAATNIKDV